MPDSNKAVKIMTIHKSKGLEFPVVIIPSLDFDIKIRNNSKFLVEVGDKIIYSHVSSKNKITELATFAQQEEELIFLDKLNLCYVALTRPIERLYAFNYFKDGIGKLFHDEIVEIANEVGEMNEAIFISGEEKMRVGAEAKKEEHFYLPGEFSDRLWYPYIVFRKLNTTEVELDQSEINFGNNFHVLMAKCNSKSEVESQLAQLIKEGLLDANNRDLLEEKALQFFDCAAQKGILKDVKEFINEELILVEMEDAKRPDKILVRENELIVIDFKTGKEKLQHQFQITNYNSILKEMFNCDVLSYLYYTETQELLQI
jgi:ATP-dependent exoDNAse (exonuclease V) beta subunit